MNFIDYGTKFLELQNKIRNKDFYSENETYEVIQKELNDVFLTLMKISVEEQKFFSASPLKFYKIHLENSLKELENEEIDFNQIDHLKKEYLFFYDILNSNYQSIKKPPYNYITHLDDDNLKLFRSIIRKRLEYLEDFLMSKGIKAKKRNRHNEHSSANLMFKKFAISLQTQEIQPIQTTKKTKTNKSLLFEGSNLNLSERFKIANEILNIDNKIRTLNIPELEKYQLLAYILGCDKDNARNLMNGTYRSKDRDLFNYFDSLDLNK